MPKKGFVQYMTRYSWMLIFEAALAMIVSYTLVQGNDIISKVIDDMLAGKYIPELVGCLANAKNIFEFPDEAREPGNWYAEEVSSLDVKENDTVICIDTITFSYDGNTDVLKDFSLDVKRGESIAITGISGCGKTTLSKLLLGLYPISEGSITINGMNFKEYSLQDIRKQIAYVPQEPYLFQGSVMDNIRMGNPKATEEEIMQAA